MILSAIVAMTPAGLIGKAGGLPWPRLATDMRRFRRVTMGRTTIVGRKTWNTMPTDLPGRHVVILAHFPWSPDIRPAPEIRWDLAGSPDGAIRVAERTEADEAIVIGGAEVYRAMVPLCARLYVTTVKPRVGQPELTGDTHWPGPLPWEDPTWREESYSLAEEGGYGLRFGIYGRAKVEATTDVR